MSVIITNVSEHDGRVQISEYTLRINDQPVIATFRHWRGAGLGTCLRAAADAADQRGAKNPFEDHAKPQQIDTSRLHQIAKVLGDHYDGYVDPEETPRSWARALDAAKAVLATDLCVSETEPTLGGSLSEAEIEEFATAWGLSGNTADAKRLA